MKRNKKHENRVKKLIVACGLCAIILTVSTYAWFIGMKTVNVSAFDVEIAAIDGLELSLTGGYNDDWSKPDEGTLKMIIKHFQNAGYRVGVNNPYSNSIAPDCGIQYHSVMIELNKRIYMDENTLEMTEGAMKIRSVLTDLYDLLG